MNNNIDLKKILKHCPRGTRLYSTTFGYVNFKMLIPSSEYPIIVYKIAARKMRGLQPRL